jgi:hypothetical protein
MLERTIIVPAVDNDGHALTARRHAIERELCAIAGGFTVDRVQGTWLDNGRLYRDKSYRYTLAVDAAHDAAIVERLPAWCAALRQLALYTSVRQSDVRFVLPATVPAAVA